MTSLKQLSRVAGRTGLAVIPLLMLAQASVASAQTPARTFVDRLSFRLEASAGGNDQAYRGSGDPGLNVGGAVRFGIDIVPVLAVQASFAGRAFPLDPNGLTSWGLHGGLGLRFQPNIGEKIQLFVDGHFGAGGIGRGFNTIFEVGLGFEYSLSKLVHLGPFVRYGRWLESHLGTPQMPEADRELWNIGIVLAFRAPNPVEAAKPPPPDKDNDGVIDDEDQCKETPKGDHPDPNRNGCPLGDADGDGVYDNEDQCKDTPKGDHPDPARLGCPIGDADNDGVLDNEDQCKDTPQGDHPDPDKKGCPDGDDDSDGVFNHEDQCPAQPAGVTPDPDKKGCPIADRDSDTVPDATDHCPDQAGSPSPNPQRNGCPGLVRIDHGQIRITQQVFFANNSATILPQSFPVLQAVADALKVSPGVRKVQVGGHTDDVGNDANNLTLSQNRANAVRTWLVAHGIEGDRLDAQGFGETRPIAPITPGMPAPAATQARAKNRRVEFLITDPAEGGAVTTPAP